ncbi:MAG: VWA domain-containing protein [Planctomycetota bacterium]
MFSFQHPAILLALVPIAPLCAWRARGVARALARVAIAAALLAAAARPVRTRETEARGGVVSAVDTGLAVRSGELNGAPGAATFVEFGDPAAGVARAAALAGPGGAVVLATPARWSAEQAAAAAFEAERAGVPVFRWSPPAATPDAAASSLWTPATPRENEPFEILAAVEGLPGARGEAVLYADDAVVGRAPYESPRSTMKFVVTLSSGYHRLALQLNPAVDGDARNNLALAGVEVRGAPRVLILEGSAGAGAAIAAGLEAQGIAVTRARAGEAPAWGDYATVVLARCDPARLTATEALAECVSSGTGLLSVVSPLEAAAWTSHRLGDLLPLTFRAPDAVPPPPDPGNDSGPPAPSDETPRILLLLVIDRSGSMTGPKMTAAKEAAIASAETLQEGDKVGVVAFDNEAHWVLEPTAATARGSVVDAISRLAAGGETHIYAGLEMAGERARALKFPVRHIIVMTDGQTRPADFRKLVEGLAADGVTVSTVGIGDELDSGLLANMAQWGRGRFYFTARSDEIPRIFTLETRRIAAGAPAPRAKPSPIPPPEPPKALDFLPVLAGDADPATEDFTEWPPIAGAAGDESRPGALLLLKAGPRPLLAVRRTSLGRTAAFAAPLDGPEAAKWTGWERFPQCVAQLVRTLMRRETGGPAIEVSADGDRRRVIVRTSGEAPRVALDGEPVSLEPLAANAWAVTLDPRSFPDVRRIDAATASGHSSSAVAWNWPEALRPRVPAVLPFPPWSEAAVAARAPVKRMEREELYGWAILCAVASIMIEVWLRRNR